MEGAKAYPLRGEAPVEGGGGRFHTNLTALSQDKNKIPCINIFRVI